MRTISQYDAQMYKDELKGLREEMTSILFDLKGKAERIEQILQFSTIEEEEHPRMRGGDPALRRGYGGSEREGQ